MKRVAAILALAFLAGAASADEGFGFGDPADSGASAGAAEARGGTPAVAVSAEVTASVSAFADDLESSRALKDTELGDIFSGSLGFTASGSNADIAVNLDVTPAGDNESPVSIDEAYARAYWGKLDLEAGIRKLSWGKADSASVLDVANPTDLSDLTVTDSLDRKIARPMLHASWSLGDFTRLEGVFEPSFEGNSYDLEGRWKPRQVESLPGRILAAVNPLVAANPAFQAALSAAEVPYPDTSTLEYAQYGLRLATTVGSSDLGLQYWCGNLPKPAIYVTGYGGDASALAVHVDYNRYHQIGADWASVVATVNARAEIAANVTDDLSGDDGSVYNPALLWSVGFDRDLVAGVNLNAQGSGSIRLMDDKVSDTIDDAEADASATKTTVTAKLSKKFMKDEFEIGVAGLWGIEDRDFLAMPSLVWTKGDTEVEVSGGIFGGDRDGELGYFDENDYVSMSLTCKF